MIHNYSWPVSMTHSTYAWYPWYTIFRSHIHDPHYLCLHGVHTVGHNEFTSGIDKTQFMSGIHDAQYLCLQLWNLMPSVSMIDNIYVWHPWYMHNIYMSDIHKIPCFCYGIHDSQYLSLVSNILNIYDGHPWYIYFYVRYPWYKIFMSGSCHWFYVVL